MLPSTPDPNVALTFLEKTREKVCWKLLSVCFACEQAGRHGVCDACAGAQAPFRSTQIPAAPFHRDLSVGMGSQVPFIQPLEHTWLQVAL